MERLIGQLGSDVKSRKLPEAQMLSSYHLQFSLKMMRGESSLSIHESEQRVSSPRLHQRSEETTTEVVEVMTERGGRAISRRMRELIVEWVVDDQGLPESDVSQTKVLRKASIRRGESKIEMQSKSHFEYRKSRSSSARQRCYIAAHFPGDNQP